MSSDDAEICAQQVGRGVPAEPSIGLPRRKPLGHECPSWVPDGSVYFITVCTITRGDHLTKIGRELTEGIAHLHDSGALYAHIWLIMPDHVHGLISLPYDGHLVARIASWKGYTKRTLNVKWQQRFFDHRLRSAESLSEKFRYIEMNPVRAGLVARTEDWPYVFYGSAGTPRPTNIALSHA